MNHDRNTDENRKEKEIVGHGTGISDKHRFGKDECKTHFWVLTHPALIRVQYNMNITIRLGQNFHTILLIVVLNRVRYIDTTVQHDHVNALLYVDNRLLDVIK